MRNTFVVALMMISSSSLLAQKDPLKGMPKDQTKLALRVAAKKVLSIPYYLVEPASRIFKKGHRSLTKEFFEDPSHSFNQSARQSIFAYNQNYLTEKNIFSFADILEGRDYSGESCQNVCPEGLDILSTNRHQLIPSKENFLSFRNIKPDFADSIIETIGYCWGHSSVMDDFHYLGFFDKENKTAQNIPTDEIKKIEYYRGLVDQVVIDEKATIIAGFSNLREMAETPGLKNYLKVSVAKKWGKNAVKLRSIGNVTLDGKKMSLERTRVFIDEVENRLISNQTPRILFAAKDDPTWSHVLNVYGLTRNEGVTRLYVLEANYFPEDGTRNAHWIEIDQEGNATYAPLVQSRIGHNRIGKIKFTFEDKDANAKYVRSLSKFCRQVTQCRD